MNSDNRRLENTWPWKLLLVLFISSVFLVSLRKIHDVDAWIHLSIGRLIWDLKGIPEKELFQYSYLDQPFSYTSWLFGVICYLTYSILGGVGLSILKAATISLAFFGLLKDALRPFRNYVVAIIILALTVLLSQYRFVLRPDIFVMVYLAAAIYVLNEFVYSGKKYIYVWPLIGLLWANSHSSIYLFSVAPMAFICGNLLQMALKTPHRQTASGSQLKTVILIFVLSVLASFISPYFIDQFVYAPKVLSTAWYKENIGELLPPIGRERLILYVAIAVTILSFMLNWRSFSFYSLFLVIPFCYLPFLAVRFQYLLAFVAGPIVVRNLSEFIDRSRVRPFFMSKTSMAMSFIAIPLFIAIGLASPLTSETIKGITGAGFDYSKMPRGAVRYMDSNNITGRVFNSYSFGQYIIWTGFPERTVYADGRGYLPGDLLQKLNDVRTSNAVLDQLYHEYGFESILITYPYKQLLVGSGSHASGEFGVLYAPFEHPDWALVYWDDVSMLFLRRNGPYAGAVKADEYRLIAPDRDPAKLMELLSSTEERDAVLAELERNVRETGSSHAYAFLGILYNSEGRFSEAIEALSHVKPGVRKDDIDLEFVSYSVTADSYQKLGKLDLALKFYGNALRIRREEKILYGIGTTYLGKKDYETAALYLLEAVSLNNEAAYIYPRLIEAYQKLGRKDDAEEARRKYISLNPSLGAAEEHFRKGLEAYSKGDYGMAIDEFDKSLDANPSNPLVHTNMGYVLYDSGRPEQALEHFKRAISLDPSHANAHYGLGLTYKKLGDKVKAIEHFGRYVELNPEGPFSAKAKRELDGLRRRLN